MRMKMVRLRDGTIRYAVSNGYRLVYALFCLVIGLGFVSVLGESGFSASSVIPLGLFCLSFFGLGYRESWTFDPERHQVVYRIGFLLWVRIRAYPSDTIARIEISHFIRGRSPTEINARARGRNKAMVVFSLRMTDDSTKDVEILSERTSAGRTETVAQITAAAMNLPFHADRESDLIQSVSVRDL